MDLPRPGPARACVRVGIRVGWINDQMKKFAHKRFGETPTEEERDGDWLVRVSRLMQTPNRGGEGW